MGADGQVFQPQPGPQEQFSACTADIAIFGGGAGGGKTIALLMEAARWFYVPGYSGVIFRRDSTQLLGGGSIWEEALSMYRPLGAEMRASPTLQARWPETGATVGFHHMQHEKDRFNWQGKSLDFVGIDELTHFAESQFWYIYTRLRTGRPGAMRPYLRATCNPDPDSFVRRLIAWWIDDQGYAIPERSGVLRWLVRRGEELVWFDTSAEAQAWLDDIGDRDSDPKSFTFIESRLEDNPALTTADPGYRGRLALQDAVTRGQLLDRNWNVRAEPGGVFNRGWFALVDPPSEHELVAIARGWDKAATAPTKDRPDPDWTRGVKLGKLRNGRHVILDVVSLRGPPGAVDKLIETTARQDGRRCRQVFWQDPAQAGLVDRDHTERALAEKLPNVTVEFEIARKDKLAYALPVSAAADPATGQHTGIDVVAAAWNGPLFSELERFPTKGVHDDQVDGLSRAWLALEGSEASAASRFLGAMRRIR